MNIRQEAKGTGNIQVAIFNQHVGKLSSLIAKLLPRIANIVSDKKAAVSDTTPYDIGDKIEYNNVILLKEIIDKYGVYWLKIEELYNEHNNAMPGFRKKVMTYFSNKYMLVRARVCSLQPNGPPLVVVKKSADKIIETIVEEFKSDLMNSKDLNIINISMEEVETCALAVVCHAFIECKILEKPPSDN